MVLTYFFNRTPELIITGLFIGIILYLTLHGVQSIARLAGFLLIPPLVIIYALQILGFDNVKLLNAGPLFMVNPVQWLAGGFDLVFVLLPGQRAFFLPALY